MKTATFKKLTAAVSVLIIAAAAVVPLTADAAQITARKLTLSNSAPSGSSTYTFNFTVPSSTPVQSIKIQICTTASGTCTAPSGWSNTGVTLGTITNLPGTWTVSNGTAGELRATTTTGSSPTGAVTFTFQGVTNPSATNTAFYGRITTNSDTGYATPIDTGVVAASTSTQIQLTGLLDESLVFCTGTSITGQNCGTVAGSSVNLNSLSSASTATGTSVMAASTNGQTGYVVTVSGATLTSGGNTITAMGTQSANGSAAASSTGSSQFGLNVVSNSSPSVGAAISGSGTGAAGTNYGTTNQFRFFTGDTVASAGANTNANTFTVSYIANVTGSQPAGTYTATMTYICTPTF